MSMCTINIFEVLISMKLWKPCSFDDIKYETAPLFLCISHVVYGEQRYFPCVLPVHYVQIDDLAEEILQLVKGLPCIQEDLFEPQSQHKTAQWCQMLVIAAPGRRR